MSISEIPLRGTKCRCGRPSCTFLHSRAAIVHVQGFDEVYTTALGHFPRSGIVDAVCLGVRAVPAELPVPGLVLQLLGVPLGLSKGPGSSLCGVKCTKAAYGALLTRYAAMRNSLSQRNSGIRYPFIDTVSCLAMSSRPVPLPRLVGGIAVAAYSWVMPASRQYCSKLRTVYSLPRSVHMRWTRSRKEITLFWPKYWSVSTV